MSAHPAEGSSSVPPAIPDADAPTLLTPREPTGLSAAIEPAIEVGATLPGRAAVDGETLQQVGRYRIHERLGRGGMATVFKAHDPGIGRDVAIKFLHASLCEEPEYRARFLSEARAAGGLSHPNIVTVHDVGEIDGRGVHRFRPVGRCCRHERHSHGRMRTDAVPRR